MGNSIAIEATSDRAATLRAALKPAGDPGARRPGTSGDPGRSPCRIICHDPPAVDAIARLAACMASDGLPAQPVVVITAAHDEGLRRQLLRAGALDVLHGDPTAAQISAAVDDAIARFAMLRGSAEGNPRFAAAHEREERVAALIEHAADAYFVHDHEGWFLDVNRRACESLGYTREELLRMRVTDIGTDFDLEAAHRVWAQIAPGIPFTLRGHQRRKDGSTFPVEVRFACADVRGRRLFIALCRDNTESVLAEEALRAREARFRRIFETNLLGIIFWDVDGGVHGANDEFLRIVGYDRSELEGGLVDWAKMTPPEHRAQDDRAIRELRTTGRHAPIEKEYVRKDGSRVWVLVGSAFVDERRGVGFVLDISRQKQTEAALRDSEQVARDAAARAETERRVLDAILEAAPAGIILTDAVGEVVRFNPAIELLWGPAPFLSMRGEHGEWKGWWADDSPRRGRKIHRHEWAMARALRGETVRDDIVEIEPFDLQGGRRTIVNSGAPVRDVDGRVIGAVVAQLDISARVAAEDARRDSEARFRALADNIAQLAWMADETGGIFWFNRRWFDYTGTRFEDACGWGWLSVHHPEYADRVAEKLRHCFTTGEPWEDTFPIRGRDGEYRWFLSRAVPIRDADGCVTRWFGTNTDVTAQRAAAQALRDADRRKDEFIGVLAHELRNPLAPVRMAVEVMRRIGSAEPRVQRVRDVIDRQVSHMARLIDDLLDVSRIARGKLALKSERCDLVTIARQTAEDYRPSLEAAGLRLVVGSLVGQIWVQGDPVRLAQMIGNLLHNAGRFTESGGVVEVRCELDRAQQVALVNVIDTGVGIEAALVDRLFDPFSQADQDLARSKGGLGLGLALTKGLAELHGGGVSVESDGVGRGATFTVRIPLSTSEYGLTPVMSELTAVVPRLRILVVEDNHDAAETLADLLRLNGHDVLVAFDGTSAVAAAPAFAPDAVISDIGLPGELDGYGVAREIRAIEPLAGAYLIALSGYANEDARRRSREAGFDVHFAKPPDIAALDQALASVRTRT